MDDTLATTTATTPYLHTYFHNLPVSVEQPCLENIYVDQYLYLEAHSRSDMTYSPSVIISNLCQLNLVHIVLHSFFYIRFNNFLPIFRSRNLSFLVLHSKFMHTYSILPFMLHVPFISRYLI